MRMENKYSPLIQHTAAYKVQHCTFPYSTHGCFPVISYLESSMQNKVLSVPLFKQKPSAITPTMLHKEQMSLDPCPHQDPVQFVFWSRIVSVTQDKQKKKKDKLFQSHSLLKILTHITYIVP